jgi:hypothetical protein
MAIKREEILLALQSSLLGEIYSKIRAIVFKYNADARQFTLRYYLENESNEDDYENIGVVIAEFISNFKFSEFEKVDEECVYSKLSISELEILDGMVYCRKES